MSLDTFAIPTPGKPGTGGARHQVPTLIDCELLKIAPLNRLHRPTVPPVWSRCVSSRETRLCRPFGNSSTVFLHRAHFAHLLATVDSAHSACSRGTLPARTLTHVHTSFRFPRAAVADCARGRNSRRLRDAWQEGINTKGLEWVDNRRKERIRAAPPQSAPLIDIDPSSLLRSRRPLAARASTVRAGQV